MHYWLVVFKEIMAEGRTTEMMRYMGGWTFRRLGWCGVDLGKPLLFVPSSHYRILEKISTEYGLQELGLDGGNKKKLKESIFKEVIVANIRGLRFSEAVKTWSALEVEGVTNRQRDVTWLALHEGLSTRVFLKSRDLTRLDRCPRAGCGGEEKRKTCFLGL